MLRKIYTLIPICLAMFFLAMAVSSYSEAAIIKNDFAVFRSLDRLTGKTTRFYARINARYRVGFLTVTARTCNSRTNDEAPRNLAFVEIDENSLTDDTQRRIFTGWMLASSPALNPLEHPIFDIWLIGCTQKPPSQ